MAQLVLVSAIPPLMVRREDNPGGVPIEVFDALHAGSIADRSQSYRDLADGPFFGNNRPGANVSQGMRDAFWLQSMQSGHRNALECIKAFSETDFRGDLAKVDVPTLVIHGIEECCRTRIAPAGLGRWPKGACPQFGRVLRVPRARGWPSTNRPRHGARHESPTVEGT